MKKLMAISSLFFCMLAATSSFAKGNEQPLDEIVAIVNEDVITKTELTHALQTAKIQIAQEHLPMPHDDVLHKQALDQLINKKLQMQLAKQAGINISDNDLNSAIEHIAQQNNMPVSELYQHINQEGISTNDYRDDMRDQMALQKLQQQEIISHINIRPDEVDRFMNSKMWQQNVAKEYHLEDILIPVSDTPSPEEIAEAKKRAQAVLARLNKGENFSALAQSESTAENALQGGDLGWRKIAEIPSAFADQVTSMRPKEIAGPIQTSNGFHLIRLSEVRAVENQQAPDKKQIENFLLQRKFNEAMQTWVSKLRSQAFIDTNPTKNG